MEDTVSVFISHSHGQDELYEKVRGFLKREFGRSFRDVSMDGTRRVDDAKWWSEASKKIAQCDVLVVIDKPSATHSEAIGQELSFAKKLGKPILAVVPQASKHPNRSKVVAEYADHWVSWNAASIANAVDNFWLEGHAEKTNWLARLLRGDR